MNASELQLFYQQHLQQNIMPFWLRHGIDTVHGGLANVMDDAGNHLNYDKYIWSQGRALWTFSAYCRRFGGGDAYRAAADHVFMYLQSHGRDEKGRWMYRLGPDGTVLECDTSIYVDGFVMNGMAEYYALTGNAEALALALDTAQNVLDRLKTPGSYGVAPYTIPDGLKTHGIRMMYSAFFYHLGTVSGDRAWCEAGLRMGREILDDFYVPAKDAILEFVSLDGVFVDTPEGRSCVPGHALESMWFLMRIFAQEGGCDDETDRCCGLIRRHLELAEDPAAPGLRLALDIDGREPVFWGNPDYRAWWVHVEALVATAYAFLHTGDPGFMERHEQVRAFAFSRYPVETGEWRQWLGRDGQPAASAALPVKDPFHLPRALMELVEVCRRISSETG